MSTSSLSSRNPISSVIRPALLLLLGLAGVAAALAAGTREGKGEPAISADEAVAIALQGEVGENDFRLSDMGPDGTTLYAALNPSVAYSSISGEYLVAWSGDDDTGFLVDDELEIFGQRYTSQLAVYLPVISRD